MGGRCPACAESSLVDHCPSRNQWFDWMREAEDAGIEWDGAM